MRVALLILNKNNLFKELDKLGVDEYNLFKNYCPNFKHVGKSFKDRNEKDASAMIKFIKGKLVYSDFGKINNKGSDIIHYIMDKYNLSLAYDDYLAALEIIRRDYNINTIEPYNASINVKPIIPILYETPVLEENICEIRYSSREWFSWDVDYKFWCEPYGITKEDILPILELYNVKSVCAFRVNGHQFLPTEKNPTYVYVLNSKRKVYSPFSKKVKWISNISKNHIFGYELLPEKGDLLIIEKSLKDCMYMTLLGFTCIPLNSETTFLSVELWEELKLRFKVILYHPDNDAPGIASGESYKLEYGCDYFINPIGTPKDTTDYWVGYGREETDIMLNKEINKKYGSNFKTSV